MPDLVSIIRWRKADTDPPTMPGQYLLATGNETLEATFDDGDWYNPLGFLLMMTENMLWADLPTVSDLTDEDMEYTINNVEQVATWFEKHGPDYGGVPTDEIVTDIHERRDRLRAALGEKDKA